jgi:hypothetical protein
LRARIGVLSCALLLVSVLTGCSDDGGDGAAKQVGAPWFDEVKPAPSAGSAKECALPVSLPLAAKWRAKPLRLDGGPMDVSQGGATLACEIDAKPAGQIGFLRAWVAKRDATDARPALEAFLAADKGLKDISYRELKAGGLSAVEATYLRDSPLESAGKRERAMSIVSPQGVTVVTLSGLDNEQYQAMLPAYALVRGSVAPAG